MNGYHPPCKEFQKMRHLLLATFMLISLTACGTADESPPIGAQDITIEKGRLVFADKQALRQTLASLSGKSAAELEQWERQFKGYQSLRSKSDVERSASAPPVVVQAVLNHDSVYQVGSTLVFLSDETEYIIPGGDESLLEDLRKGVGVDEHVATGRLVVHHVRRVLPSVSPGAGDVSAQDIHDAPYQREFTSSSGIKYKFVFEVYAYTSYNFIVLGTTSKFEYLYKRWHTTQWRPAGETVEKHIRNLSMSGAVWGPFGSSFNEYRAHLAQTDNTNLSHGVSIAADCLYNTVVTGSYYSRLAQSGMPSEVYEVSGANWYFPELCVGSI